MEACKQHIATLKSKDCFEYYLQYTNCYNNKGLLKNYIALHKSFKLFLTKKLKFI